MSFGGLIPLFIIIIVTDITQARNKRQVMRMIIKRKRIKNGEKSIMNEAISMFFGEKMRCLYL